MVAGDENIWRTIALPLTRMSIVKHQQVLRFLLDRVVRVDEMRSNYYQALAKLNDPKAVPALKTALAQERKRVCLDKRLESFEEIFLYSDYLQCCAALYRLDGSEVFKDAIKQMQNHPDESVRTEADRALSS
jgi:HEAT repeat protein